MSQMTGVTVRTVCLDCPDAHEMARFYGTVLGWEPTEVEPDWVLMRDPQGGTGLSFQRIDEYVRPTWPEKSGHQQKMIHLELKVTPPGAGNGGEFSEEEGQAALAEAVKLALSAGGILAQPQFREDLRVVLDPAGHPLCLFL
jgi:catechol 2,3-dioxygenase-like lactoylglutathione lyase family enzyme